MVRNIVVIGGTSHPHLTHTICNFLGVAQADVLSSKFSVGETRVEIKESVRGKDVFIIQSGGGKVNDHLMELLITISACKTASAKRVTAILPLFPYSRQSDVPYNKNSAPLVKSSSVAGRSSSGGGNGYIFESTPSTPNPTKPESAGLPNGVDSLHKVLAKTQLEDREWNHRLPILESLKAADKHHHHANGSGPNHDDSASVSSSSSKLPQFQPRPGYRQRVARAGTLIAELLTSAGADHIITMDLHDPQYQGFFDIPVDNLYGRPLLKRYIQHNIPNWRSAIIVSPDAGGAKRATAIADSLGMEFALIHKVGGTGKNSCI